MQRAILDALADHAPRPLTTTELADIGYGRLDDTAVSMMRMTVNSLARRELVRTWVATGKPAGEPPAQRLDVDEQADRRHRIRGYVRQAPGRDPVDVEAFKSWVPLGRARGRGQGDEGRLTFVDGVLLGWLGVVGFLTVSPKFDSWRRALDSARGRMEQIGPAPKGVNRLGDALRGEHPQPQAKDKPTPKRARRKKPRKPG